MVNEAPVLQLRVLHPEVLLLRQVLHSAKEQDLSGAARNQYLARSLQIRIVLVVETGALEVDQKHLPKRMHRHFLKLVVDRIVGIDRVDMASPIKRVQVSAFRIEETLVRKILLVV